MSKKLTKLFEKEDLKDPTLYGCCILPTLLLLFVVSGLLYKFGLWAFGG